MGEQKERSVATAVSLYPKHLDIVGQAAEYLGLEGNIFSPALQFIITDWKRMRDERENRFAICNLSPGALHPRGILQEAHASVALDHNDHASTRSLEEE